MNPSPIFLLSTGRSGTNMLRSMLGSGFSLTDLGEVFRPKDEAPGLDFFPYLVQRIQANPDDVIPRAETCANIFDGYVASACKGCETSLVLFDLKYPHTHNLNPLWHQPTKQPYILELIKERGYPILHLVRRNVLARLASMKLAKTSGTWVDRSTPQQPLANLKVTLETEQLIDELTSAVKRIRYFEECLIGYPNAMTLDYESIVRDGPKSPDLAKRLATFLDLPLPEGLEPTTRKIAPSLRAYIANYDEVALTIRGTPFADMLGS
jgi:hypothetical protein